MKLSLDNQILPRPRTAYDLRLIVSTKGSGVPEVAADEKVLHMEIDRDAVMDFSATAHYFEGGRKHAVTLPERWLHEGIASSILPGSPLTPFTLFVLLQDPRRSEQVCHHQARSFGHEVAIAPLGWLGEHWNDGEISHSAQAQLRSFLPLGQAKRLVVTLDDEPREGVGAQQFAELHEDVYSMLRQSLLNAIAMKELRPASIQVELCDASLKQVLALVLARQVFLDLPWQATLSSTLEKKDRSRLKRLLYNMNVPVVHTHKEGKVFDLGWVESLIPEPWVPGLYEDIHRPTALLHAWQPGGIPCGDNDPGG